MKYRKKPVVIDAYQWLGGESNDVLPYGPHRYSKDGNCRECDCLLSAHGWVNTLEGGHIVCPDDWIITGVKNEKYPCKPDIFEMTYELAEDEK